MGYRSDVYIALRERDAHELLRKLNELPYSFKPTVTEASTSDEKYVLLSWISIKWYDDLGVRMVEDFIKERRHSKIEIGEDDEIVRSILVEDDEGIDEEFYEILDTRVELTSFIFDV